jgi:hypothetical protein
LIIAVENDGCLDDLGHVEYAAAEVAAQAAATLVFGRLYEPGQYQNDVAISSGYTYL